MTLNHNEKVEDEAEQTRMLKDCHQRCADRTLKVLEKNGSIFIKLGQHLVSGVAGKVVEVLVLTVAECYELFAANRMDCSKFTIQSSIYVGNSSDSFRLSYRCRINAQCHLCSL